METTNFTRNPETGLVVGVDHIFNTDGTVNWRAMIPGQFLAVKHDKKEQVEREYGKKISELDLTQVDDKYLLLLLPGIKHIARLRGIKSVEQSLPYVTNEKVAAICKITFIGNFESSGQEYIFSDVGSASFYSVSGGEFQLYLESLAANRAFVRCVRNALGINITARDEMDDEANRKAREKSPLQQTQEVIDDTPTGFKAQDTLKSICNKRNLKFDDVQKAALAKASEFTSPPDKWTDFDSIPSLDCFTILDKLNSAGDSKKKVKS